LSFAEKVLTRPKVTDPLIAKIALPYALFILLLRFMVIVLFSLPYYPISPKGFQIDFHWILIPPTIDMFNVYLYIPQDFLLMDIIFELLFTFLHAYIASYLLILIIREHKPKDRYFELPYIGARDSYFEMLKFFLFVNVLKILLEKAPQYFFLTEKSELYFLILKGIYWVIGIFFIFTPYIIILNGVSFSQAIVRSYNLVIERGGIVFKVIIASILSFSIFEWILSLTNNFLLIIFGVLFIGFPLIITLNNFIIRELMEIEGVAVNEQ